MPGKSSAVTRAEFIAQIRRALGKPYVYGAAGPGSFDCSGLVYWACQNVGIDSCPRTSEEQFAWSERVTVPLPGDLVFFTGAELDPPPGHVGVVIAPGLMIDAPYTGTVVQQGSFGTSGSGVDKFMGYGRMPGVGGGFTANQAMITKPDKRTTLELGSVSMITIGTTVLLLVLTVVIVGVLVLAMRFR